MPAMLSNLSRFWKQSFFIPTPPLTEKNLPDQSGRVAIITGGYAGVGYELSKIIYQCNGTVYVAGRSERKAKDAVGSIKKAVPNSKGRLEVLIVDLSDLSTIKPAVEDFVKREQRLDVLTNNAGVMATPITAKGAQGHELQMCTNCLGPYLLTTLLLPLLEKTAASSPPGSVRVTWAGSLGIDVQSPSNGGMNMSRTADENLEPAIHKQTMVNYGMTKVGNLFLASQSAIRYPGNGVQHIAFNPGNLASDLGRHLPKVAVWVISAITFPSVYGAYTELFCGWAEEAGRKEHNGGYVIPWGQMSDVRADVQHEVDVGKDGESGKAVAFWDWCESETRAYQ